MAPDREAAVRTAVEQLVAALLALVRAEVAQVPAGDNRLLSIGEAAAVLGVGRTALYQELTTGRLRSFKVGRRRLIPTSAIDAYIEAGAVPRGRDQDDVKGQGFAGTLVHDLVGSLTREPGTTGTFEKRRR